MNIMKWICLLTLWLACITLFAQESVNSKDQQVENQLGNQQNEPPMLGIHWAKDFNPARARKNVNMIFHNGEIMPTVSVHAIFWGSGWSSPGDKITGLDTYYSGYGGSGYAHASDEYTGTNGQVTSNVSYTSHTEDLSTASGGGSTSAILAEVCKEVTGPVHDGFYPVYVDLPRGSAGYCGYHSAGMCNGVIVQFAFFWNLDGDAGCDPGDTSGLHSEGLSAVANTSSHELSEARTDPNNGGWYDSRGQENGDKCNFTFAHPLVTFFNGSQWKAQAEWSNAAFTAGTGFPNSSGQHGCIDN
jgi:hypothetical protein